MTPNTPNPDFDPKAKRIAVAFGYDRWLRAEQSDDCFVYFIGETQGLRSWIILPDEHSFTLQTDVSGVMLQWDSEARTISSWLKTPLDLDSKRVTHQMVRALYCLGYDTIPIEAQLELPFSAHEKTEWLLDFHQRLGQR